MFSYTLIGNNRLVSEESFDPKNLFKAQQVISSMTEEEVRDKLGTLSSRGCASPIQYERDIQIHHAIYGWFENKIKPILNNVLNLDPVKMAQFQYGDIEYPQYPKLLERLYAESYARCKPRDSVPNLSKLGIESLPADFEDLATGVLNGPSGSTLEELGWKKGRFSTISELVKYFHIGEDGSISGVGAESRNRYINFWNEFENRLRKISAVFLKKYFELDDDVEESSKIGNELSDDEDFAYAMELMFGRKSPIVLFRIEMEHFLEGDPNIMVWKLDTLCERVISVIL